jgi:hypothetical protein
MATDAKKRTHAQVVWEKLGGFSKVGPSGVIPIKDHDTWVFVYNSRALAPGVELYVDPARVETLRLTAARLIYSFPRTMPALRELSSSAEKVLSTNIKTRAQVKAWANSIFNVGPVAQGHDLLPRAVADAVALSTEAFHPQGLIAGSLTVVTPVESEPGKTRVIFSEDADFSRRLLLGHDIVLGPRSPISKAAFAPQTSEETPVVRFSAKKAVAKQAAAPVKKTVAKKAAEPKAPSVAKKTVASKQSVTKPEPGARHRGRPRGDGLLVNSDEVAALKDAYARKVPVPDFVIAAMTSEAHQHKERERNERLANGTARKTPAARKPAAKKVSAAPKSNVVPIKKATTTAPAKKRFNFKRPASA